MRRRLLGVIGIGAAAVLMLSGFDTAMTVSELQKNSVEALKTVKQFSGAFNAGADITLTMTQEGENGASVTMPLTGEASGSFAMTQEPLGAAINLWFSGSGAGEEGSGSMDLYVTEKEDGTGISYVHTVIGDEDSGWQAASVPAESMEQVRVAMNQVMNGDIDSFLDQNTQDDSDLNAEQLKELMAKYKETLGAATQLSSEPADAVGKECYELVTDITGSVLTQVISDAAEVAGQALDETTLAMVGMIASSLDILVVTDFDTETCLPVAGSVNLAGSDFSLIGQILASTIASSEEGASMSVDVSRLGADYNVSYDDFGTVTIPEEALAAPVYDASQAIESVVNDVTDVTDGMDETEYVMEEAPINDDGSYHLEDSNFDGEAIAVDVFPPEGLECSYSSPSYISFSDENYRDSISYSLYTYSSADETLEYMMDVSYMEEDDDYSDITVSEPAELTLENGNTVKYTTISYKYEDYLMGSTYAVIPVDEMSVLVEIRLSDDEYNLVEATPEDVVTYTSGVTIA